MKNEKQICQKCGGTTGSVYVYTCRACVLAVPVRYDRGFDAADYVDDDESAQR